MRGVLQLAGEIYITTDVLQYVESLNTGVRGLTISDPSYYMQARNIDPLSIDQLLKTTAIEGRFTYRPEQDIFFELEDSPNRQAAFDRYMTFLSDESTFQLSVTIMMALYKGVKILVYIDQEEIDGAWVNILLNNYFLQTFGLTIGMMPNRPCAFDVRYSDFLFMSFYRYSYISYMDLLKNLNLQFISNLPVDIVNKIAIEMGIKQGQDPMLVIGDFVRRCDAAAQRKVVVPFAFK